MKKKFVFWLAGKWGIELITPIDYKSLKEKVKTFEERIRTVRNERDSSMKDYNVLKKIVIEQQEQLDQIQSYLDNGTLVFKEVEENKEEPKPKEENENRETTSENTPIS